MPGIVWLMDIGQQFVGAAASLCAPAALDVLKTFEPGKVCPRLELGPAASLTQLTAAKKGMALFEALALA